jgi:hypothetical protein
VHMNSEQHPVSQTGHCDSYTSEEVHLCDKPQGLGLVVDRNIERGADE